MTIIIVALFIHFLADFVFQTSWMSQNKSKSFKALSAHIIEYMYVSILLFVLYFAIFTNIRPTTEFFVFILINSLTHFGIDTVTSRLTSYFWKKQEVHNFFVVVGFDQLLHTAILIWSVQKFLF